MIIEIPDNQLISTIEFADLEEGWRNFRNYSKCQPLGDKWYNEGKVMILKVPSVVLPDAFNYVINSEFPYYRMIQLIGTTDIVPDVRIEDILKKYPK